MSLRYSFFAIVLDGIIEIPQGSNLSWLTLFYALPKELVEKYPPALSLPRNIYELLDNPDSVEIINSDMFLQLVWDCYAWSAWQFFQVPSKDGTYKAIPVIGRTIPATFHFGGCPMKSSNISAKSLRQRWIGVFSGCFPWKKGKSCRGSHIGSSAIWLAI